MSKDKDLDWIEKSGGFEWTPGSPWPPEVPDEEADSGDTYTVAFDHLMSNVKHSDYYYDYTSNDPNRENPFENDGLDYEVDYMSSSADYMSDIDDQYAHYYTPYQMADRIDYEPKSAHYYKYHEEEILKDIEEYVSGTYQGHYTGNSHEFRKVQTIDLMASKDLASGFCQANILKYGSRYGNKDGRNQKDLLKVIHYAMLLLHFDGHYSKPPMTTGNIDINMP